MIKLSEGKIKNPKVIKNLTSDGSNINDWEKFRTRHIEVQTGQKLQIHLKKHQKIEDQ